MITIKARVEDFGLLLKLDRAPDAARKRAGQKVRAVSLGIERGIKNDMPVDSGRARASWGHWTADDLTRDNPDARASDAVYVISDGGLTVTQGSNVEYVAALNEGHSQQAPAGFIDTNAERGGRALEDELGQILGEVL